MYRAEGIHDFTDGRFRRVRVPDVHGEGARRSAEFLGGLMSELDVPVQQGDLAPVIDDHPGRGASESRRAAGYYGDLSLDVHSRTPVNDR